jgi:hypothetical protein
MNGVENVAVNNIFGGAFTDGYAIKGMRVKRYGQN